MSLNNPSVVVPHLSPSLTASVNSSSLPSPKDGDVIPLPDTSGKFSPSDAAHHTARELPHAHSAPPKPFPQSSASPEPANVRVRTVAAQQAMAARFHPYARGTASPLELRFTARALGHSSHISLTLEDVQKGKPQFLSALSNMPDRLLMKAYAAKQADRECAAQRLSLALAEIESAERHMDYLSSIRDDHQATLSVSDTQLDTLKLLMDERGLSELSDDGGFYRAVYADELIALSIANGQMAHMHEVMAPRFGRGMGEGFSLGGNNDEDSDSSNDDDIYPELPSSDPLSD